MNKMAVILVVAALTVRVAAASEADYRDGMKALQAGDYPTALTKLESAVADDPDNLRFASDYRQAVIHAKEYDRCLKFFEQLTSAHPQSPNAHLNYGFAYVDKIPAAGSITQVILANSALTEFTKSIEIQPSWLADYTRGASYLYWPRVFERANLGVADLEKALEIQRADKKRGYYVRTYIALGDGYWKMDDLAKAKKVWKEGLEEFPGNPQLRTRLSKVGDDLREVIEDSLDFTKRVDTNLQEIWANP